MNGLILLFTGRTKEAFVKEGIEKYEKLLRRFVPVEVREIKGSAAKDKAKAVEEEADSILGRIPPQAFVIVLDERGKLFDSQGFAAELEKIFGTGRDVVFVVGGPFGLSERVRLRAGLVLSLSKLTFTHEIARVLLMEQLYRATTIIKGRTYHY